MAWIIARRLPQPRALALLMAGAIAAIAAIAVLTRGDSGSIQRSAPVTVPSSPHATCEGGSPATRMTVSPSAGSAPVRLDSALSADLRAIRLRLDAPAATAAVVVCGRVIWADATGVLDLRSRRPAGNDSLFVLNSAAKTFVATMVMQEIQDGHLSLTTRLSRFYPRLPDASEITVRMLLNMTSGLPDYLDTPRIAWVTRHRPRHHWTVDQVLTGLGAGLGTPKFSPGYGFQYSDTNYIVLGAILQQITRRSIQHDFEQLIARPLGITSATFVPTPAARALIAHPYRRDRDGTLADQWIPGHGVSSAVWGPVFTDGGLAASSVELAWFGNALLGGRLVSARALRQMTRIGPGDYGFGLRERSFDQHEWLGHRGYFGGFEAEGWTDPSRQVTIAVATNLQGNGGQPASTAIWKTVARAYDRRTS